MDEVYETKVADLVQHDLTQAPIASADRGLLMAGITGLGYYVPQRVLTNADLERMVETNDEWIRARTGIRERRIAAADESTADLAENAARQALQDAGVSPGDVQLIIVATCTPDYQFPSTASLLQDRLRCSCAAFDLETACSGFGYALVVAQQFIATGAARTVLVVGAEVMSRILDWSDRTTCILFGDGAGAAVVQAVPHGFGVLGFDLGSDGSGGELLKVEMNARATPGDSIDSDHRLAAAPPRRIVQNGREVYRFAVNVMGESALRALASCGIASEDVDLFVPHQANIRIIEASAKRLKLDAARVFINVDKYGNTSAASIPIALCEARAQGRIKHGDTVVTVGFGGGLTWASTVMRWV
ncbi:MAG TPA: beta-ketoacyl-ACP synthase III [Abditibacteriaceae bacterium]|nr:beta-ketoacyl-ACP synthase III [Abditibacteriaceae bacterium]